LAAVLIAASNYGGGIRRHLDLTAQVADVPIVQLPETLSLPHKVARLRAELRRHETEHLVTHGVAAALAGRLRGSALKGVAHTEFWHGDPFFGAPARRMAYRLLRRAGRLPDRQVFVERSIERLYGERAVVHERLPNAVPIPPAAAARPAGLPRRAAFVGRLSPEKGYRELLAAWPTTSTERGWILEIYGSGPLESLAVPGGVTGHGQVADSAALMGGVDLLVVPSWTEASPYAVLEAMAHGVPFVGSAVGDMPEIARGAGCAWLVPPRDVGALERALRECQEREASELRAAGLAGQRWLSQNRPFEGWLSAIKQIYWSLPARLTSAVGA
jgi:glycosyltransferase involved in cell wall biosynthesis